MRDINGKQSFVDIFILCRNGDTQKVETWLQQRFKRASKLSLKFLRTRTGVGNGSAQHADTNSNWLSCMREPSTSYTPLHLCALYGYIDIALLLLTYDRSIIYAIDRRGCRAIHLAAWAGHISLVEHLLNVDPSSINAVNNSKESSLHLATLHGHTQIVQLLMQKGADARLRNARFETALDIAARTEKPDICQILLARCPELTLQSASECTPVSPSTQSLSRHVVYPLHLAARYGNIECVRVLCEAGFDPSYVTDEGTALHVAAAFGRAQCVALLIQYGSDINIRDAEGKTALERLQELEKCKNLQITHVAQSAHGWRECQQIIEEALNSPKLSANFAQLPDQLVFHNNIDTLSDRKTSNSSETTLNGNFNNDHKKDECAFRMNFSPKIIPRASENSYKHFNKFGNAPHCNYQKIVRPYNNVPEMACNFHVNTPSMGYDNALPNDCRERQWIHNCCASTSNGLSKNSNDDNGFATVGVREGQKFKIMGPNPNTMPQIRPTPPSRPSVLKLFACNDTINCQPLDEKNKLNEQNLKQVQSTCDSATTSGFSTLEKVENYEDFDTNAPIAMPEELDSSTYGESIASKSSHRFQSSCMTEKNNLKEISEILKEPNILTSSLSPTSTLSTTMKVVIINNKDNIQKIKSPTLEVFKNASGNDFKVSQTKNPEIENKQSCGKQENLLENDTLMRRNHSAEWRKIDEILTSIQRASFFGDLDDNDGPIENLLQNDNNNHGKDEKSLALKQMLQLSIGLNDFKAQELANILYSHGFDSIQLLKGSVNRIFLTEMCIEKNIQDELLIYLNKEMKEMIPNVENFDYLSDWLDALELIDYLGAFANTNLTHTPEIIAARLTRSDLEKMGIHILGHIARIIRSLEMASPHTKLHSDSKTDFLRLIGNVRPPPIETLYDNEISNDSELGNERHFKLSSFKPSSGVSLASSSDNGVDRLRKNLLDESISFSAHYLGSTEIPNVEGATDCRNAMNVLKKRVKQVNKHPQILLEISVGGINVLDLSTNQLTVQHEIGRIQVVCQDELDLNCFAYIYQDNEKNFCHVYCVLTAEVAKEIIITLGEAFNLAYAILGTHNNVEESQRNK